MRVTVVDEHHAVTDKDVVFDCHAFADERMTGDFAARAYARVFLNLDKGPQLGFVTDAAAIEVDEVRDADIAAQTDIGTEAGGLYDLKMLGNAELTPLFGATVDATEEAVVNALVAADTMTGRDGLTVYALPHERLREILRRYNRLVE